MKLKVSTAPHSPETKIQVSDSESDSVPSTNQLTQSEILSKESHKQKDCVGSNMKDPSLKTNKDSADASKASAKGKESEKKDSKISKPLKSPEKIVKESSVRDSSKVSVPPPKGTQDIEEGEVPLSEIPKISIAEYHQTKSDESDQCAVDYTEETPSPSPKNSDKSSPTYSPSQAGGFSPFTI